MLDRYKATLLGVHIGDSIGAPYETWGKDRILADFEHRGGLTFFAYTCPWREKVEFPIGRPTDDSDQTAALAQSLIKNKGLDEEHLYQQLRETVFDRKSVLWGGGARGAGKTTRDALRPLSLKESVKTVPANEWATNGSLMRAAPMALYFGAEDRIDFGAIERMSAVTHRNPLCGEVCKFYVHLLVLLLNGWRPVKAVMRANIVAKNEHIDRVVYNTLFEPVDPGKWPERGEVCFSLHVALHALICSTSFKDGIEIAISVGGDTDTYAAIAGALLGARYAYHHDIGVPIDWRKAILGRRVMSDMAECLYELAQN